MRTVGLDQYPGKWHETEGELPTVTYFGATGGYKSKTARKDLLDAMQRWRLWITLGWLDVQQRDRRAVLGPFWITISMTVLVLTVGAGYGRLFKQDVHSFLPYLAAGFIVWNFCTAAIVESTTGFVQ